jgi:hyperosmotically inducible protein
MQDPQRQSHLIFAILLATLLILPILSLLAGPSIGAEKTSDDRTLTDQLQDSWKRGLLEGAYLFNSHLSNFKIGTEITGNTAVLKGAVSTRTERALAEQIALSIKGIDKVENELEVRKETGQSQKPKSGNPSTTDAAITTKVKSQLLANPETSGLDIEVEVQESVVTLKGEVDNEIEKALAYYVVRNTSGVDHVINQLQTASQQAELQGRNES